MFSPAEMKPQRRHYKLTSIADLPRNLKTLSFHRRIATRHWIDTRQESSHSQMSEGWDDFVIDTLGQRGNNDLSLPRDMSAYVFLPWSSHSLWKIQVIA